jgi:sulfur-carrier protein adenylyltransferase/sulfurtransferase
MTGLRLSRYDQHIELPEVQVSGQKKLYNSKILIVGAGGLGCPVGLYLTGAGIGTIGLIDGDCVEESNLHRQVLYKAEDIGRLKAEVAKENLSKQGCNQIVKSYPHFLDKGNAQELISQYDLVIDATDNHIVRLLINKICLDLDKPWIYGALYRFEGQTAIFNGRSGACFSCLFPNVTEESALPTCKTSGVLSPVPGILGCMQALEAIKVILGLNEPNKTNMNIMDFLSNTQNKISVSKNPSCHACACYK